MRYSLRDVGDYKALAAFTGVTTSKGRQQARMLFKRKVEQIMIEN